MMNLISIILISLLSLSHNTNLRKEEYKIDEKSILENLIPIYNSLYHQMLEEQVQIKKELPKNLLKDLDTEYFKSVESTSKIKFYQDKELKDFHSIVEDILTSMKIPDFFASQIFKYKIVDNPQIFYNGNSVSFNLINSASDDKNKIAYGSLYVTKKEDKYNFIFCYGFGNFNRIFNGFNAFNLGKTNYHESMSGAVTSSIYFPNSIEESYLMHFMDLVGLKVLGNNFSIDLPYPDFN